MPLRRRIRIFLVLSGVMFAVVVRDIVVGELSLPIALASVALGGVVGFFSSRIFHLSWHDDGKKVVGRIDTLGWVVLGLYVAFEIARSTLLTDFFPTFPATAITFAFVASALITRVLGLRGRILRILKEEEIF